MNLLWLLALLEKEAKDIDVCLFAAVKSPPVLFYLRCSKTRKRPR